MAAGGGRVGLANADGPYISGIRLRPLRMTQSRRAMLVAGLLAFLLVTMGRPCCHGWVAPLLPSSGTVHAHSVDGTGARDKDHSGHRDFDCPDLLLLDKSTVAHLSQGTAVGTLQPPNLAAPATTELFPAPRWIALERGPPSKPPWAVSGLYLRTSRLLI